MTVYLGEDGLVLLKRTSESGDALYSDLGASDVNVERRRFSFDFEPNALITGAQITIATEDGSPLELVAGHTYPDGQWYCHIDDAGGVRLYTNFQDAVNGDFNNALPLVAPSVTRRIWVRSNESRYRGVAQMQSWELTTSRQSVDTTSLGEEFVAQFTRGLVSGQGTLTCLWDYRQHQCDTLKPDYVAEEPQYLCQLLLRLQQGSAFRGQFYVYKGRPSVWYEADALITNVGMSFAPGELVASRIDFVTTGRVSLHTGFDPGYLLQQNGDLILLENSEGALLLEDPD